MEYFIVNSFDGFGAQYQRIIQGYIYCRMNGTPFAYKPFDKVEHNDGLPDFNNRLEHLVNLKDKITTVSGGMNIKELAYDPFIRNFFEPNIDACCNSEHMAFIKRCFWENKPRDFFANGKKNIAVHIRRANIHDRGQAGARASTPNQYYLQIMDHIRNKYGAEDLQFHVYSQGDARDYADFLRPDVKLYMNTDAIEAFIGMVAADVLVISPSSFSYTAALLSDGEVYYKPFWHNPRSGWILCS